MGLVILLLVLALIFGGVGLLIDGLQLLLVIAGVLLLIGLLTGYRSRGRGI